MTAVPSPPPCTVGRASLSATSTRRPSGLTWMPRGRAPTGMDATARRAARSTTLTVREPSLETKASWARAIGAANVPSARKVAMKGSFIWEGVGQDEQDEQQDENH